jgi:4,5-DOPA dioxygenase extradiol
MSQKMVNSSFLKKLSNISQLFPTIFFGHGSPLNAIESNIYTKKWQEITANIPRPGCILIISAHWQTRGTVITSGSKLPTIHDFGGFPPELSNYEYSAVGNPKLAEELAKEFDFSLDENRGLDHGSWSVLAQIYPDHQIPVLQISLDVNKSPNQHFELGQKLASLRSRKILIIASGNIVHNLGLIDWNGNNEELWARDFDSKIVENIQNTNFDEVINYHKFGDIAKKSVPSPEHFLPLLYVCGASNSTDKIQIFNQEIVMSSISMTSVIFNQ